MAKDDEKHLLDWIRPVPVHEPGWGWYAECSCGARIAGESVGQVRQRATTHGARLRGSRPAA